MSSSLEMASCRPSGDQDEGEPAELARTSGPAVPSVRCQPTTYPPRFSQEKATCRPSGVHRGALLSPRREPGQQAAVAIVEPERLVAEGLDRDRETAVVARDTEAGKVAVYGRVETAQTSLPVDGNELAVAVGGKPAWDEGERPRRGGGELTGSRDVEQQPRRQGLRDGRPAPGPGCRPPPGARGRTAPPGRRPGGGTRGAPGRRSGRRPRLDEPLALTGGDDLGDDLLVARRPAAVRHREQQRPAAGKEVRQAVGQLGLEQRGDAGGRVLGLRRPDGPVRAVVEHDSVLPAGQARGGWAPDLHDEPAAPRPPGPSGWPPSPRRPPIARPATRRAPGPPRSPRADGPPMRRGLDVELLDAAAAAHEHERPAVGRPREGGARPPGVGCQALCPPAFSSSAGPTSSRERTTSGRGGGWSAPAGRRGRRRGRSPGPAPPRAPPRLDAIPAATGAPRLAAGLRDPPQLVGHVVRGVPPVVGRLREAAAHQPLERRGGERLHA